MSANEVRDGALRYIRDMSAELMRVSLGNDFQTMACLFSMAVEEAAMQLKEGPVVIELPKGLNKRGGKPPYPRGPAPSQPNKLPDPRL